MIAKLKYISNKLLNDIRFVVVRHRERKKFNEDFKQSSIYEGSDEEYRTKVLPFWQKYGMKPSKKWFQYYGYLSNSLDPYIIPNDFFYSKLIHYLNHEIMSETLENKHYCSNFISEAYIPTNYLSYINGFFINDKKEVLAKDDAIQYIIDKKESIFKPTNSCQGNGVKILRTDKIDVKKFLEGKIAQNKDFIIQELIIQSDQISAYNKSSLNTVRVISLLLDDKVEILSSILRVGGEGSEVDNFHKGGESRPINKEGIIQDYAVIGPDFKYEDRNGKAYIKEKIKGYDEIIKAIKINHPKIPHIRWIGWDFGIDKNHKPVFIEFNAYAADNQRECGASFGELTPRILDEYFNNKKRNAH